MKIKNKSLHSCILVLSFLCFFASFCEADSVNSNETTIYATALVGYDPRLSNIFANPDPGRKNLIFTLNKTRPDGPRREAIISTPMRAREDSSCDIAFSAKLLKNFDEYVQEMHSQILFESEDDVIDLSKFIADKSVWECYQADGSVTVVKATCITHSFALDNLMDNPFASGFSRSIFSLTPWRAAAESKMKKRVISFVRNYGTHYMKRSYMGSSVVIEIRTSRPPGNEHLQELEEAARSFFTSDAATIDVFSVITKKFTESYPFIKITTHGAPPAKSMSTWAIEAAKSPVPVKFELEFITSWFRKPGNLGPGSIDGEKLVKNLEENDWLNPSYLRLPSERSGKHITTSVLLKKIRIRS